MLKNSMFRIIHNLEDRLAAWMKNSFGGSADRPALPRATLLDALP
jgi:hypothetical protein